MGNSGPPELEVGLHCLLRPPGGRFREEAARTTLARIPRDDVTSFRRSSLRGGEAVFLPCFETYFHQWLFSLVSVSQMPIAEGKSVQQTVEILTRKLELLGAEKQGTFCVDCETYHTAASTMGNQGQTAKLMYVMHNSEYPLSCFALFENGPCLIADANFDVLMVKLKGFFQNAKGNKIESRGTRYQYCDFLVKVGTVTMGPSARGISVEVEYCPCVVANDCWNLLMEFMQSFMGSHAPGIPSVFGNKHDSIYSSGDTMVQYMELFNKIRKQQQVPIAGIR
nr:mediator of RNA polymerase II transcription subunit 20 [Anolis sagrei ordinatus]